MRYIVVQARLDECNERVMSKTKTSETCFEEVLDFYHCVDHCAAPQIFHHVK
jgi:ubiquinol-cytochrome c reductase subunit 6